MEIIDPRIQFTKNEYLTFKLNEHEKIIIKFNVDDVLHCCYRAKFFFVRYNHKILLQNWAINEDLQQFIQVLEPAIKCQLSINSEFTNEIGYLWNYVCNKKNHRIDSVKKLKKNAKNLLRILLFSVMILQRGSTMILMEISFLKSPHYLKVGNHEENNQNILHFFIG